MKVVITEDELVARLASVQFHLESSSPIEDFVTLAADYRQLLCAMIEGGIFDLEYSMEDYSLPKLDEPFGFDEEDE